MCENTNGGEILLPINVLFDDFQSMLLQDLRSLEYVDNVK